MAALQVKRRRTGLDSGLFWFKEKKNIPEEWALQVKRRRTGIDSGLFRFKEKKNIPELWALQVKRNKTWTVGSSGKKKNRH